VVFRVSPHRHSQSLSRDVPSTIRLPSAIVPENDDEKDDIEKSTKKEIEEDLNIFCRRRLKSCRAFFLPFWCSQKSFFFSRARERRRDVCDSLRRSTQLSTLIYTLHTRVCYNKSNDKMTTILLPFWCSQKSFFFSRARKAARRVPILCVALCVRQKMRDRFFFAEKKRREEKKKIKKKKKSSSKERFKNPLKSLISPQIFRHASLFWKNWISSPVRHNNKRHSKIKIHTRHI